MNRLVFLCFFFPLVLEGQELRFTRIDAEQGKSSCKIYVIDQDPHGFMWFLGTGERYLYKYDGWRITIYGQVNLNLNTLGGTDLSALHVDDSGNSLDWFRSRVLLNLIDNAFYAVSERLKIESASASHQVLKPDLTMKKAELNSALLSKHESILDEPVFHPLVSVRTRKIDQNISITISDNGTGIPPSIISKIFQPFFTTKPIGEGTGLGLSMAYDIITKAYGVELLVKSTKGVGTVFEIVLPVSSS